ncbi:nuclear transport factor 2 family protein [Arthrobacter sp. B2a2-09]|uniref:nuclear transport factor 2 family protein n=1 Tax=Arthrobacter sp. B2a2-09 TaxID=2952822 RepID=UPI0022CDB66C|nr:nuclear transport factor 2 family protein [Arthrobacter sp. B2a2-09]MCZ9883200.1 nuclear transport factor 2 family protein [Arthrobacter sp. B2a2-09]
MSRQTVAAARRYYDTVDNAGPEDIVALFDPAAEYRRPGYAPMIGRDALLEFYGTDRGIVAGSHRITSLITDYPDRVAVEGRFSGQLRDGRTVDLGFADFFCFQRGLILTRTTYFETAAV